MGHPQTQNLAKSLEFVSSISKIFTLYNTHESQENKLAIPSAVLLLITELVIF